MDDIVARAIAKWPNVPYCHGWLALDARGVFRMRDEAAQAGNLPGDPIRHAGLLAFIYRNYAADESGAWYFQNGPQRVYVDLLATPFIARTDLSTKFVLHDGQALANVSAVFITEEGQLILHNAAHTAMIDDRDLAQCLPRLTVQGKPVDDLLLMQWLQAKQIPDGQLSFVLEEQALPVTLIMRCDLGKQLGFISRPRPAG